MINAQEARQIAGPTIEEVAQRVANRSSRYSIDEVDVDVE
jgi:hypothetical protein